MKNYSVLESLIFGRVEPHIYAFTTNTAPNFLKIGDTYRPVSVRLKEWERVYPGLEKQFEDKAKVDENVYFRDYSVHRFLEIDKGKIRLQPSDLPGIPYSKEFFKETTVKDVSDAISEIVKDYKNKTNKYQFYNSTTNLPTSVRYTSTGFWSPRPNQQVTIDAFKTALKNGRTNLLMYAVMRFGKSFTSMCCAVAMNADLVVIVSAKADVADEWKKTVESAENFSDYNFFTSADLARNYNIIPETLSSEKNHRKVVAFLTLQDLQGENIKDKHQQIFGQPVDLLIVDETHFGARAEKYGAVLNDVKEKASVEEKYTLEDVGKEIKAFTTAKVKLHLSGTPYRILMGGEFSKEDIIAFCQFTDIANDQKKWDTDHLNDIDEEVVNPDTLKPYQEWDNPYYGFPQMIRFAFNLNESARRRLDELRKSRNTYTFSTLFKPVSVNKSNDGSHKKFIYEREILDLLEVIDGSKDDDELLGFLDYKKIKEGQMCKHIVCVLPYCASCDALESLIISNPLKFKNLNNYKIINISGVDRKTIYRTPKEIKKHIHKCEEDGEKTITLTVNRMLTGSTVEEWDTMLYLKDTASPQEYDQAIFRLQNQYIKTFVNNNGETIKYNMKPQTLLVDFDPNRMFVMQEQKAQIYNINIDESGNNKLSERIREELRVSPIIVMNKDKMEQIQADDILCAVSEYSKNRGVIEETLDIPVDISLMNINAIREVIEQENELGSRAGITIRRGTGDGQNIIEPSEEPGNVGSTKIYEGPDDTETKDQNKIKDHTKQFQTYFARILFFAFLTKNIVISLKDIIECLDIPDNIRISHNIHINKAVLKEIQDHANKFMLQKLDYKILNLNKLSHDESLSSTERAFVAIKKFGRLGESEIITPQKICINVIDSIPDQGLINAIKRGNKVLDIAGKAGEFELAIFEKYTKLGYKTESIKNTIYTIPTSGLTYEFTRMVYEILGLNTDNIAKKFTSYSLLDVKDEDDETIDYDKICCLISQDKPFNEIELTDDVPKGDKKVKFDVVVGNPPYQKSDGGAQASAKPIYHNFVYVSNHLKPKYITFIIPTRWYAGGKGLDDFRNDMLNDPHIEELNDFLHPEEVFPDTNNRGGVCFYLWNSNYNNTNSGVRIISHEGNNRTNVSFRNLRFRNSDIFVRNTEAINILNKIISDDSTPTMSSHVSPRKPFGLDGAFIKTSDFNKKKYGIELPVKCYGKAKAVGYVKRSLVTTHIEWIDKWKVLLPYANNIGTELKDDNQNSFVAAPKSICTETFLVVGADLKLDKNSAKNLSAYLRTKFARFLLSLAKISQHGTSKTYRFVPVQDFSKSWTDAALYKKYGLSNDEIKYIESTIKPMDSDV